VIGCDLPTALQITKRLESEGFIAHDVAKSKLWRKRAYEILKTNETKSLMDAEYFDPLKKISHHVSKFLDPRAILFWTNDKI
jgi:meiosis-specific protein HOP1